MKKLLILLTTLLAMPMQALAHVKWFVDTDEILTRYADTNNIFYQWTSNEVVIWSIITFVIVVLFGFLDKKIKVSQKILQYGYNNEKIINKVAKIIFGIYLVSVSFIWGIIISPDLLVNTSLTTALQYLQGIFGLMFIFNLKPRIASIGVMLLFVIVAFNSSWLFMLENIMVFGLAFYFLVISSPKDSWIFLKFYKHGVELVRIATGVTLITLAFSEKFLYPELSLEFLAVHDWNFMKLVFASFTDGLFVLSVGFAEMIFGILFIMGYLTRITTILIAVFFAISVTSMLVGFNLWEVEDLVVYSAAILFLFYGHGRTKFFHFN